MSLDLRGIMVVKNFGVIPDNHIIKNIKATKWPTKFCGINVLEVIL